MVYTRLQWRRKQGFFKFPVKMMHRARELWLLTMSLEYNKRTTGSKNHVEIADVGKYRNLSVHVHFKHDELNYQDLS